MDGTTQIGGGAAGQGGAGWSVVGTGTAAAGSASRGAAQSSAAAFTFSDISADLRSTGGAMGAMPGVVSPSQSSGGADVLLLPPSSTLFGDHTMPYGTR